TFTTVGRGADSLLVARDQLIREGAVAGMNLGEVRVAWDNVKERRGVDLDVLVARTFEFDLKSLITGLRGNGLGITGDWASLAVRKCTNVPLNIGADLRRPFDFICVQAFNFEIGDREGQVDSVAGDLPAGMSFAARMRARRQAPDHESRE